MRNIYTANRFFDRRSTRKLNIVMCAFFTIFAFFITFAEIGIAQETTPTPTKPKTLPKPTTAPLPKINPGQVYTVPPPQNRKKIMNEDVFPAEKSIETDPKVNIYFKACEGNVKINGWDRDEVRAYVKNGTEVGFKIQQKGPASGKPIIISIFGYDPQKHKNLGFIDSCISGEEIELDVPRAAVVKFDITKGDVDITSIRRAEVQNLEGDVWFNDISQFSSVRSLGSGDITVENSRGNFNLWSANGNITVLNIKPVEVTDSLITKNNGGGTTTLQSVEHTIVKSNSISGIIKLISNISSGGQYNLSTNSSIYLLIPIQTSCQIKATYGNFLTEIPLANKNETPFGPVKQMTGQLGSGDASLVLTTQGIIQIKKSN